MEFSKLSRFKVFFTIAIVLSISACSLFAPFVDRRRNAGERDMSKLYVGESTKTNPAICYNILNTSFEEVQEMADKECIKHKTGKKAKFVDERYFECRLFLPNRMYFQCEE